MDKLNVIDIFSGAGGLSLGFQDTGKFNIVAAVEKNPAVRETYKHNFEKACLYSDIRSVDFKKVLKKCGNIDVVIGGPPCQGFSNANRQHNQAINQNNKLVKEYIRAILELKPKAFVMENVSMLKSKIHRFYIEDTDVACLEQYKIVHEPSEIFLLPQEYIFDGVLDVLRHFDKVQKNQWSDLLYKKIHILYKNVKNPEKLNKALKKHQKPIIKLILQQKKAENKYIDRVNSKLFDLFFKYENNSLDIKEFDRLLNAEAPEAMQIQMMLNRTEEIYVNHIIADFAKNNNDNIVAKVSSCAVYDYLTNILGAEENGYLINQGVLSAVQFGIPQKRKRFILIGIQKKYTDEVKMPVPEENVEETTVEDAIKDLENVPVFDTTHEDALQGGQIIGRDAQRAVKKLKNLRDNGGLVYNHIIPKTRENAMARFKVIKEGENFHSLKDELKENTYTNVERTQNTIYLRLKYNEPSGTVVNVRKSMWIHPHKDRAISVREAARLQTFPDSFRFYGTKDAQYQQVGNAVPPMLAKVIAKQILLYIRKGKYNND